MPDVIKELLPFLDVVILAGIFVKIGSFDTQIKWFRHEIDLLTKRLEEKGVV